MTLELPALPYDRSALEPHLSAELVAHHHGRHQRANVARVNALAAGTEFAEATLETTVRKSQGALFDHAAQVWNDAFYWDGLAPAVAGGGGEPGERPGDAIVRSFGDLAQFKREFASAACAVFGAGWIWLLQREHGALAIATTANAATPLIGQQTPLLACCLWEHAYESQYPAARDKFIEAFWNVVNWKAVAARMV